MQTITYNDAIEKAGFGRFQKKLMLICGFGWATDAMEILLIAFVLPVIAQEWNLSKTDQGLLATSIFIGMLAGAWVWGRLIDVIGRKIGFIFTVAISAGCGLLSAFAPSFGWLLVLRALTGFGVGGMLPVDYAIFSEYLPARKRGRYLVLLESFWALGTLLAAGLSWLIIPNFGWRWLMIVSGVSGAVIYFIRRYIPESPRYLAVKGRHEEASEVIRFVAKENGVPLTDFEIAPMEAAPKTTLSDLLKPSLRRTTAMLWIIWFFISLGYYGVFTWMPNYFRSGGMQLLPVYQNSFILGLAQLPGYFSAAYLVEKIGRRRTLGFYLFASGIFTFLFAAVTNLNWMVAMGVWMSFFALGAWGALYAYTPEAYPTNLRGTGMGTASGMTRIAGAIAPSLGAVLMSGGLMLPLSVFAAAYAIAGLAAFNLPLETSEKPLLDTLEAAS